MAELEKREHELFCQYFVDTGGKGKAYQKAYQRPKLDGTCYVNGCKLFKNPDVHERIKELQKEAIDLLNPANFARMLAEASLQGDITQYLDNEGTIDYEGLKALPDSLKRLITECEVTEKKIGEQASEKKYKIKLMSKEFAVKHSFDVYKYLEAQQNKTNSMPSGYEVGQISMNIQISNPSKDEQKNDIESPEEDD